MHSILPNKQRPLNERQDRIYKFLSDHAVGVLATVTPDNKPHGSVIYLAVSPDFTVSFLTKTKTRKHANILRNSNVMLIVFDPWMHSTLQLIGRAEKIKDHRAINEIAAAVFTAGLKTSEGGLPPIAKMEAGHYSAFRIKPQQIRLASYAEPDSADYDRIFESMESFEQRS